MMMIPNRLYFIIKFIVYFIFIPKYHFSNFQIHIHLFQIDFLPHLYINFIYLSFIKKID